jgi:predicted MFS family arabinose efflux permease
VAIFLDAVSFLLSALGLWAIRAPEPPLAPPEAGTSLRQEIGEGWQAVAQSPFLRAFAAKAAFGNLGFQIVLTVFVLYGARGLGLDPAQIGLVFAAGSIGNLLGAVVVERTAGRFGIGPTIVGGSLLAAVGLLLVPLAQGPPAVVVPLLAAGLFVDGLGTVLADVHMLSVQQAITPDRLQGRVNATTRFLCWGIVPLGGLLGGALGAAIGLRPTIAAGAVIYLCAVGWLLRSPVWAMRDVPAGLAPAVSPSPLGEAV